MTTYREAKVARARWRSALLGVTLCTSLGACDPPEEKVASYLADAQALFDAGDATRARLQIKNVMRLDPERAMAWSLLARVAVREGNWQEAVHALRRVLSLQPENAQARLDLGGIYLSAGAIELALEQTGKLREQGVETPDVRALHAAVLLRSDDVAAAEAVARAGLEEAPEHVNCRLMLATVLVRLGKVDDALGVLNDGLAHTPKSPLLHVKLVETLVQATRRGEALAASRQALDEIGDQPWLLRQVAFLQARVGELDAAEMALHRLVEALPDDMEAKLELISFLTQYRGEAATEQALLAYAQAGPAWHLALGAHHESRAQPTLAAAAYRATLAARVPETVRNAARTRLAKLAWQRGDTEGAHEAVSAVLQVAPMDRGALLTRATFALEEGDIETAISDARTVLRNDAAAPAANLLLARAYSAHGAWEVAIEAYERAAGPALRDDAAHVELSTLLLQRGALEKAQRVIDEGLELYPTSDKLAWLGYRLRAGREDWDGAMALVARHPTLQGQAGLVAEVRAMQLMALRRVKDGLSAIGEAMDADPRALRPVLSLVRNSLALNAAEQALHFLEARRVEHPDAVPPLVGIAQLHLAHRRWQPAVDAFREVLRLDAGIVLAHLGIAAVYERQGELDAAEAALGAALPATGHAEVVRFALAGLLERRGDVDGAIAIYETIMSHSGRSELAANNLASLLTDNRDDAASLRRAVELEPLLRRSRLPHFADTRAWILHRSGETAAALPLLQRAMSAAPNEVAIHYHHGMVRLALGQPEQARQSLEKAIALAGGAGKVAERARRALAKLDAAGPVVSSESAPLPASHPWYHL